MIELHDRSGTSHAAVVVLPKPICSGIIGSTRPLMWRMPIDWSLGYLGKRPRCRRPCLRSREALFRVDWPGAGHRPKQAESGSGSRNGFQTERWSAQLPCHNHRR